MRDYESNEALQGHAPAFLTLLHAYGNKRLTKQFSIAGCRKYDKAKWFNAEVKAVSSFDDLSSLLTTLECQHSTMVVVGSLASKVKAGEMIQRLSCVKQGQTPTLIDKGSRVLHFDIDKREVPAGCDWSDPERMASEVWNNVCVTLPALQNVSVHWQASSSAGMPEVEKLAKFHFWVLLDRPINAMQRKEILIVAEADKSLASIVQPNYTAAPVFHAVKNPLEGLPRSGAFRGARDFVDASRLVFSIRNKDDTKSQKATKQSAEPCPHRPVVSSRCDAALTPLQKACAKISEAKERNNEINKQSYYIGGLVAGGYIDHNIAQSSLLEAAAATGHDRYIEAVNNGFQAGLQKPIRSDVRPAEKPYHAKPDLLRDHAIHMHGETIRTWAAQSIAYTRPIVRARQRLSSADAQSKLENQDVSYPPRVMLTGAQGVGKTATLVGRDGQSGALHGARGMLSIMLLPTHRKVEEAAGDFRNNATGASPRCFIVRGRGSIDPESTRSQKMCRVHERASALAKNGLSVRNALCKRCPFSEECGYQRQERELSDLAASEEGAVLFATHDYAFVPLPARIKPDLIVFDERPRDFGVETDALSISDLREVMRIGSQSSGEAETTASDIKNSQFHAVLGHLIDVVLKNLSYPPKTGH